MSYIYIYIYIYIYYITFIIYMAKKNNLYMVKSIYIYIYIYRFEHIFNSKTCIKDKQSSLKHPVSFVTPLHRQCTHILHVSHWILFSSSESNSLDFKHESSHTGQIKNLCNT